MKSSKNSMKVMIDYCIIFGNEWLTLRMEKSWKKTLNFRALRSVKIWRVECEITIPLSFFILNLLLNWKSCFLASFGKKQLRFLFQHYAEYDLISGFRCKNYSFPSKPQIPLIPHLAYFASKSPLKPAHEGGVDLYSQERWLYHMLLLPFKKNGISGTEKARWMKEKRWIPECNQFLHIVHKTSAEKMVIEKWMTEIFLQLRNQKTLQGLADRHSVKKRERSCLTRNPKAFLQG